VLGAMIVAAATLPGCRTEAHPRDAVEPIESSEPKAAALPKEREPEMAPSDTIGTATMQPDGTIVLDLRAEGPGVQGDARLVYPKGHQQYDEVLKHLGGLTPGESKPVPPWPDDS
jgi:hypothetical protein